MPMSNWLYKVFIWYIERDLYNTPVKKALDAEKMQQYYETLFHLPGFRQYIIERETRFIHTLANQNTDIVKGQRIENALLFTKARLASEKSLAKASQRMLPRATSSTGTRP